MRPAQVKKSRCILRKDDRGAALIAVIVTLVFVMTMGAVIMEVTTTNSRMSEIALLGKGNFYSADEIMEELKRKMADVAAGKVQEAYMKVLEKSSAVGGDFQTEFNRAYMEALEEYFRDDGSVTPTTAPEGSTPEPYRVGKYKLDKVSALLPANDKEYLVSPDPEELQYIADYEEGLFILKNLTVRFTEGEIGDDEIDRVEGNYDVYETLITTDLVFHTPVIQLDGGTSKSFMDYSLIADVGLEVTSGINITVNGSVYAGVDGVVAAENGVAKFTGNTIVTRGDIVLKSGANLVFENGTPDEDNNSTVRIWAENIRTENATFGGGGEPITLYMNGEINIADDLEINGDKSKVTLKGYYNGYNFRENYDVAGGSEASRNSQFSSGIMINGKACNLDLAGIKHLFLAGRTFIKRGDQENDIMLGESLSVRSNQLAYYVSDKYLQKKDGDVAIKIDDNGYVCATFLNDGLSDYIEATGVENLADYLVTDYEAVRYIYKDSAGDQKSRYYLNFKSEESANEFFSAYWEKMGSVGNTNRDLSIYGTDYALAIRLDTTKLLTLRGDVLYRNDTTDPLKLLKVEMNSEEWKPGSVNWKWADRLARTYKSLADDLAGDYNRVSSADVRFGADDNTLFENLIDEDKLDILLKSDRYTDGQGIRILETYGTLDTSFTKGIVIAKMGVSISREFKGIVIAEGNVEIIGDFDGIVIAKNANGATGTVTIYNNFNGLVVSEGIIKLGGGGITVSEDVKLVQELLAEYPEAALVFEGYQQPSGVRIADYVTYENWTKN